MSVLRDYAAAVSHPTLPLEGLEPARYDEMVAPAGGLRPAWKAIASVALDLSGEELHRVEGEIRRFLADDGVTYVTSDAGIRPWRLDPLPLLIDAASWAPLEVGLAQRAELLNAIAADLYGPQTLLASGIVPAASVFAHSGFVRPLVRSGAGNVQPLLLSAADLGRDADGQWHVLADRVQAPSGLGFAMENRRVISQVLPELYQESVLHRMEPYFSALRAGLLACADDVDDPHVVVLTPGPHSETAFDQAFLANALGFPLVQGSDLVVRDGYVWVKPAGWPARTPTERVDVIVRRVDAEWCDPLELRGGSQLGVAGLAEAVRRGRVRLANDLGTGVLENPALMPYLPAACEALLGEQLRLPSVPTWWCGDPEARAEVLDRLASGDSSLFVRTIDGARSDSAAVDPGELSARISAAPHRFVAQQELPLSQAPSWGDHTHISARSVILRTFTVRYGSAYRPLVGGLASVRAHAGDAPTTKDVWVLKAAEDDADQGLAEVTPLSTARTVPTFAPRALADMFWAGRYGERAEDLLRLLLTAHQQLDQPHQRPSAAASAGERALLDALQRLAGRASDSPEAELRALLLDAGRRGTAARSIARLREALEGVRDQLSGDTWRVFSSIDRATRALRSSPRAHRTAESGGRMLAAILSLRGVSASMMRDSGWHMIEAGQGLERALQICHLLTATLTRRRDPRSDRAVLEATLTAAESIVTYRRRYRGSVRIADALELLLLDPDNPRSLAFSVSQLRSHLAAMPASTGSTRPERLLEQLALDLQDLDVAELAASDDDRRRPLLERFLADTIVQLEQVSDAMADTHFESGPPPLALSSLALVEERGA